MWLPAREHKQWIGSGGEHRWEVAQCLEQERAIRCLVVHQAFSSSHMWWVYTKRTGGGKRTENYKLHAHGKLQSFDHGDTGSFFFLSFFLSWGAKTRLIHWTKGQMEWIWLQFSRLLALHRALSHEYTRRRGGGKRRKTRFTWRRRHKVRWSHVP